MHIRKDNILGRKRMDNDLKRKVDTKIKIREDLKIEAKKHNINFSKVMEEALKKILNKD